MSNIAFIRHGQTDWNLARKIQGSSDIPLNQTGISQATDAGIELAKSGLDWQEIFASPLSRAFHTAQLINQSLGLDEPKVLAALAERNYGEAEGLSYSDILNRYGDPEAVPGRESTESVRSRMLSIVNDLMLEETGQDKNLVMVSHGGAIRVLLELLTSGKYPNESEPIQNGSIHLVKLENGTLSYADFEPVPAEKLFSVRG